jgi:hypothetical protein
MIAKLVALSAFTIIVLVGGYYIATNIQVRNSIFGLTTTNIADTTSSSNNAVLTPTAITSTYTTIQTTSCATATQMTSTQTSTTTASTSTQSTTEQAQNLQFTYSPQYPVAVESVKAVVTQDGNGNSFLAFSVIFQNIGNTPIYVTGGCGGTLSVSVSSPIVQQVTRGPLCECMEMIGPVNPGQNHTAITPGCWDSHKLELTGSGTVNAILYLYWSSSNSTQHMGTTIDATFTF